jgi:hypothetical protein
LDGAAKRVGVEIGVAREGIELIAGLTFCWRKLQTIQSRLGEGNAVSILRQLDRLTNALSDCEKPWLGVPSPLLIVRTQVCFAIEQWKCSHAQDLEESGYDWEHSDDCFPEFNAGTPSYAAYAARGLGHPLLPAQGCVRNNVVLDVAQRFYIVSSSNMSGKSTLLRSIELSAVLATAGSPFRAASLQLSELQGCASLSIGDSILEANRNSSPRWSVHAALWSSRGMRRYCSCSMSFSAAQIPATGASPRNRSCGLCSKGER